mmetsp:Transcript_9136/g.28734  ORF Transcript_9136/g.28734 Transcript_9136/m.28734 type:complete len:219 (-) Transcript_9136:198-854(-)
MCSRFTSICDQGLSIDSCVASRLTASVYVAEKKSVCTSLRSRCRIRFDWSPSPPKLSISSASSRTNMRMLPPSSTFMLSSETILPGVPMTICSVMRSPRSQRSSRRIHLTLIPLCRMRYLPILSTSSSICFASSRVGQMHSACGVVSGVTMRSMPRTKQQVLPVPLCACASRLRPILILGSDAAWIFDGRENFISYSPLRISSPSSSAGSSKEVIEMA